MEGLLKKLLLSVLVMPIAFCGAACDGDYNHPLNIIDDAHRTYYEVFVGGFYNSEGTGTGNLRGLTLKLDYLSDLGINGLWLMPVHNSPSYHKYDVVDYKSIDSAYGNMRDFERLIDECNNRGIWVMMDLVINHSSKQHEWFKQGIKGFSRGESAEQNKYVDYYEFSFEEGYKYHYDSETGVYYHGEFDANMPDFNLDCEDLRAEFEDIVEFWIGKGVRGFRLDAVKHLYMNGSQLLHSRNIEALAWFNQMCREKAAKHYDDDKDFYNVGEVWDTESNCISYMTSGMSTFAYSFGGASNATFIQGIRGNEDADYFGRNLTRYYEAVSEAAPDGFPSFFLTNHDNDRSASILGSHEQSVKNIKKCANMYLLLPGNPYIYYGEEIGMRGKDTDPNRRLGMYWDEGIQCSPPPGSNWTEGQINGTVAAQENSSGSILNHYKRVIKLRNQNPEIARGEFKHIELSNKNLFAYSITYNGTKLIVLQNLSDSTQKVTFKKSSYGYGGIRGYACSNPSDKVKLSGNKLTVPAGSVVILK